MAETLVEDLEALEENWSTNPDVQAVIALARKSLRWDVTASAFDQYPDVIDAIYRDEADYLACDALNDYRKTVDEVGKETASIILRAISRLASITGFAEIWRGIFQNDLTAEEIDKTFPLSQKKESL